MPQPAPNRFGRPRDKTPPPFHSSLRFPAACVRIAVAVVGARAGLAALEPWSPGAGEIKRSRQRPRQHGALGRDMDTYVRMVPAQRMCMVGCSFPAPPTCRPPLPSQPPGLSKTSPGQSVSRAQHALVCPGAHRCRHDRCKRHVASVACLTRLFETCSFFARLHKRSTASYPDRPACRAIAYSRAVK